MKIVTTLFCFLFIVSCTNDHLAQGYVVDTDNNPLQGIKVQVNSSDIYTITDAEGYFEIDPNGISEELLFHSSEYQLRFVELKTLKDNDKVILAEIPVMLNTSE